MLIGYACISKADGSQVLDLQRDALTDAGVKTTNLYEDRASGKKDDRPGLAACLKALRKGDVLVVWKLDRLGRDLRHLVNVVHELTTNGIGFRVLTGQGANIDTTTSSSFSMSSFKRAIGASALDTCVTTRAASASAAQVRASAAAQQRDWLADGSQPTQRNGNDGRGSAQDGWRPSRLFGRRTNRRPALR